MNSINKKGIMKMLIWIVIFLVILGIVYMGYSYLDEGESIGGSGLTGGDDSGSSKAIAFGSEDDKPPRPPE